MESINAEVINCLFSDHKEQIITFSNEENTKCPSDIIHNKSVENKSVFLKELDFESWAGLYDEKNSRSAVDIFYNTVKYYHVISFLLVEMKADSKSKSVFSEHPQVVKMKKQLTEFHDFIEQNHSEEKLNTKIKKYEYEQLLITLKRERMTEKILTSSNKQKTI
ncbi:hypothetical protein JTB14_024884 [Gonioctena quinquepunctata]|nr:hypothetical protein JTB14_024884 [Gonioctena quinquepunctata]